MARARRWVNRITRNRSENQRKRMPVRLFLVLLMGKHERITDSQHEIVHRWVHRDEWIDASNISMLHEQGHELNDAQKDVYEAWQCAKRDVISDMKKHTTYKRTEAYYLELIANPELEVECPCCTLTYTVRRDRVSTFKRKCMLCSVACPPGTECVLTGSYSPHQHNFNPFPEIRGEPRGDVFPMPK